MRNAFVKSLINSTKENPNIHLISGDLGFMVLEPFIKKFPNNFTNAGVEEGGMVGIAAGMAHLKLIPVCYSIAPFLTFRALEQIRNDICYHDLNVKIIGIGGGYSYTYNGQSHCAIEDIAVMRSLPNVTILCPGDPLEAYYATSQMLKMKGPVYLRLGKAGEPMINYESANNFKIGKTIKIQSGKNLVVLTTGNMLETTVKISDELENRGVFPTIVHVPTIKPINKLEIENILQEHQKVVTIEEHSVIGGLGSTISEINSTSQSPKQMLIIGVEDKYFNVSGTQNHIRKLAGIDETAITKKILEWL